MWSPGTGIRQLRCGYSAFFISLRIVPLAQAPVTSALGLAPDVLGAALGLGQLRGAVRLVQQAAQAQVHLGCLLAGLLQLALQDQGAQLPALGQRHAGPHLRAVGLLFGHIKKP
jgi:hypothetical protein